TSPIGASLAPIARMWNQDIMESPLLAKLQSGIAPLPFISTSNPVELNPSRAQQGQHQSALRDVVPRHPPIKQGDPVRCVAKIRPILRRKFLGHRALDSSERDFLEIASGLD